MYTALIMGGATDCRRLAAGVDFCVRQYEYTSALTADSPEVRAWIDFAEINNGTFRNSAAPGDPSVRCGGDLLSMMLLTIANTATESAWPAANARLLVACWLASPSRYTS